MATTIQSLFPFTLNRGDEFTVIPCYAEFEAPIGIGGKYIFNSVTTPAVEFGKLLQGQTGIIAGVMITANCLDFEFTSGIEKGNPLKLQVLHGSNNTPINMAPFPFTSFSHGENFTCQWSIVGANVNQEETFKIAVSGEVNQILGMTNNSLLLRVSFNFYRVGTDKINPKKRYPVKVNIYEEN